MNPNRLAAGIYDQEVKDAEAGNWSADALAARLEQRQQQMRTIRAKAHDVLKGNPDQVQELRRAEKNLGDAVEAVKLAGGKIEKLDPNVGGDARLGVHGSQRTNAEALKNDKGLPDKQKAIGLRAHEKFHEGQKQPNAGAARIGEKEALSARGFIEVGAIIAQKKAAPRSIPDLSLEYRGFLRMALEVVSDEDELMDMSKNGDILKFEQRAQRKVAA